MSSYTLTFEQATRGIYASWRLFLRDPRAAELLDNDYRGAVRSYWAALVILPVYLMTVLMEYLHPGSGYASFGKLARDTSLLNAIGAETVVYTLCWFVAWPLIMDKLVVVLRCEQNFFRYVCGYNWMHLMYAILTVLFWTLLTAGIIDPESIRAATVTLAAILGVYHWFVLRHTLNINGAFAALLSFMEFMFVTMLLDFIVTSVA